MAGSRFDEAGKGLNKPIGLPTNQERSEIAAARRHEGTIGKFAREARKNGDLKGYMDAVGAGYRNRGIENTEDKDNRYRQTGHQRFMDGSAGVGGAQPNRGAQQPAGGQGQPPNPRASVPPVTTVNGSKALFADNDGDGVMKAALADREKTYRSNAALTGTQPAAPAMSAAEQSKQATLEKTLAGNFGPVAQARAQAKQSEGTYDATPSFDTITEGRNKFVDTVNANKGEDGFSDKFEEQARKQGAALGLTNDQIEATLEGSDISPEAMGKRAQARKDQKAAIAKEAYDKEFKVSDDYIEEAIAGLGDKFTDEQKAAIRKNMAGLKPEQRKEMADRGIADTETANAETTRKAKEFKDILPAVKEELQGLIDAQDKMGFDSSELRKLRGSPAISKEQKQIIDEGGSLIGRGGVELDPVIPSGNPLFDNPEAESVAWARGAGGNKESPISPAIDSQGMLADRQPILDEHALRSDRKEHVYGETLGGDIGALLRGGVEAVKGVGTIAKNVDEQSRADSLIRNREEQDSRAGFKDYVTGKTGEAKTPTTESISKYAKENKITVTEAGNILRKKSAEARGEKFTPQASINPVKIQGAYEKASKGADDILFGLSFDQQAV